VMMINKDYLYIMNEYSKLVVIVLAYNKSFLGT